MGLRLRLRADFPIAGFPSQARVDPHGAEALRDDRRRQRLGLVRLGRTQLRAGTTTSSIRSTACTAPTSWSWTRPSCGTASRRPRPARSSGSSARNSTSRRSIRLPSVSTTPKRSPLPHDLVALLGGAAELAEHEARDRVVVLLRHVLVELLVEVVDRERAGDADVRSRRPARPTRPAGRTRPRSRRRSPRGDPRA